MARRYHVYRGDAGGPIRYDRPVADVAAPPVALSGIAAPSTTRFGVRAYDDVTGYEEKNVNVVTELIVNASGQDVSDPPAAPVGLTVTPLGLTALSIRWRWMPVPGKRMPDRFNVYVTPGAVVDFATPSSVIGCYEGTMEFFAAKSGLAGGAPHAVAVRSATGTVEETNISTVVVMTKGNPPLNVSHLTAAATYRE